MALDIDWRFAGPQDINIPQSNFLNSLDKNIQKALEIKKEFDKKRDDNEMISLMTEETENKLAALINEKDELTTQYNLLTADEQLAQKTNYENKLNELDIQINAVRKEVDDARMNANQFKTTGTTDFYRWKVDSKRDLEKTAMNKAMLDEQIKSEKLSNLYTDIKIKQNELNRTDDEDKKVELNDDLNLLKTNYNKLYGEEFYKITGNVPGETPSKTVVTPGETPSKTAGGSPTQTVEWIKTEINSMIWSDNLENSDKVNAIREEIGKYNSVNTRNELTQALDNKIKELNAEHEKELADDENKRLAAATLAAKTDKDIRDNLESLSLDPANAPELLKFYNNVSKNKKYRDIAKAYLINILAQAKPNLFDDPQTAIVAARRIYGTTAAMQIFIDNNKDAINKAAPNNIK